LLPLLERCTRELQGEHRYKTDIRYLRLWIKYADCLPDPGDVFSFLRQNEIGQEHALFYTAYATYQETRKNYTAADQLYQEGIHRLALPTDVLKSYYRKFQHRMAARIQRKQEEEAELGSQMATSDTERPTLGTIRSSGAAGTRRAAAALMGGGRIPAPAGGGGAGASIMGVNGGIKRKAFITPGRLNAPSAAGSGDEGGLSIFVDAQYANENMPSTSAAATLGSGLPPDIVETSAPGWSNLGGFEQTRKENIQSAKAWAGQKLKPKASLVAAIAAPTPAAPALDIPLDPEFEKNASTTVDAADIKPALLRQRLDKPGSADITIDEKLASDPLRLHKQAVPTVPPPPTAHGAQECVYGFDKSLLIGPDGEEQCFEEAKARHHQIMQESIQHSDHPALRPTPFDEPSLSSSQLPSNEPTLATKEAFDAINRMFQTGGTIGLGGGMRANPFTSSSMSHENSEPTMTISTQQAFNAVNRMFKGSISAGGSHHHQQQLQLQQQCGGIHSSSEPTASMQEAFAAVNKLFGSQKEKTPSTMSILNTADGDEDELLIRQDTQFLNDCKSKSDTFCIREDTIFINKNKGSNSSTGGLGLDIREDTVLLGGSQQQEVDSPGVVVIETGGCQPLRQWGDETVHFKMNKVGDGDDEALLDDGTTQFLDQTTAVLSKKASTGLTEVLGRLDIATTSGVDKNLGNTNEEKSEEGDEKAQWVNQENLGVDEAAAPPPPLVLQRRVGELKELSNDKAAQQNIEVETDEEAEQALKAEPEMMGHQDSFEVYCDTDLHQAAAASTASSPTPPLGPPSPPAPPATSYQSVDPFHPSFQQSLLENLHPPVSEWPGVVLIASEEEEDKALATFKKAASRKQSPFSTDPDDAMPITLGDNVFGVKEMLGSGAYAQVFSAIPMPEASANTNSNIAVAVAVALKVESPPCPWEWYIGKALHGRVSDGASHYFINPTQLLSGRKASIFIAPRGSYGSLQDAINTFLSKGQVPDEALALHFTKELLYILKQLHDAHIVHADVKPDNLLVVVNPSASHDENALPVVSLQLIDFGRSIDLELLPSDCRLAGDSDTDAFRCVEMREGNPWLHQADSYGVACVAHCLLFGEYMEVERLVEVASGRTTLRPKSVLRRYWATTLWECIFDTLLNKSGGSEPPVVDELIERIEEHFETSKQARKKLDVELKKIL